MGIIDDEGDPDDQDDEGVNGSDGMGGYIIPLKLLRLLEHVRLVVLTMKRALWRTNPLNYKANFIKKS